MEEQLKKLNQKEERLQQQIEEIKKKKREIIKSSSRKDIGQYVGKWIKLNNGDFIKVIAVTGDEDCVSAIDIETSTNMICLDYEYSDPSYVIQNCLQVYDSMPEGLSKFLSPILTHLLPSKETKE